MNDTKSIYGMDPSSVRVFSADFRKSFANIAEFTNEVRTWWPAIMAKVKELKYTSGLGVATGEDSWFILNATYSGGSFTTGVAPTDLGDGIFEYKGVPVKITGYSAGAFTYELNDDPAFDFEGTSVTVLNPPTHENDADWKYAGVSTGAGSDYPAGYDIRGIGEDRVAGTWHSVLVRVQLYIIPADGEVEEQKLWLMMAEPDHDGSCESGGEGGGDSYVPGFFGGS